MDSRRPSSSNARRHSSGSSALISSFRTGFGPSFNSGCSDSSASGTSASQSSSVSAEGRGGSALISSVFLCPLLPRRERPLFLFSPSPATGGGASISAPSFDKAAGTSDNAPVSASDSPVLEDCSTLASGRETAVIPSADPVFPADSKPAGSSAFPGSSGETAASGFTGFFRAGLFLGFFSAPAQAPGPGSLHLYFLRLPSFFGGLRVFCRSAFEGPFPVLPALLRLPFPFQALHPPPELRIRISLGLPCSSTRPLSRPFPLFFRLRILRQEMPFSYVFCFLPFVSFWPGLIIKISLRLSVNDRTSLQSILKNSRSARSLGHTQNFTLKADVPDIGTCLN